jgi:hypothetical protein
MSDQDTKPTLETVLKEVRSGFAAMDKRLAALEAQTYDTKPIWQRALGEILEVKETLARLERRQGLQDSKLDDFIEEVIEMKRDLKHRV